MKLFSGRRGRIGYSPCLAPARTHLQGGFHSGHSLPTPLAAGWELAHPALLSGDRSCALLVAELWLLKPTLIGASPASLDIEHNGSVVMLNVANDTFMLSVLAPLYLTSLSIPVAFPRGEQW
jgi:hypothetical protein